MKRFFCILILAVSFLPLSAQEDTQAKSILDQVSEKNRSYKSLIAEFSFSLDNKEEDIHEFSEGVIILKGNKYRLDLMETETYFDGTTIYTYLKDAEEVNIKEPDEEEEEVLNPAKIFSIYENGFKYKYLKDEQVNGKDLHVIDLFPVDLDKSFSRVRLKIDKKEMQISSMITFGKDGNNITIKVNKMTPNIELKDNDFIFDTQAHPNVEVVDMR
ncbi:MAG: outer membrane lipoprotein carrier protein LolA [Marinifilaceae bacterium]|jgi:outer membrane lipoprotein-sorting protein